MAYYINLKMPGQPLETIDEFDTLKEAKSMWREYVFSYGGYQNPGYQKLYVSSRCCKAWKDN